MTSQKLDDDHYVFVFSKAEIRLLLYRLLPIDYEGTKAEMHHYDGLISTYGIDSVMQLGCRLWIALEQYLPLWGQPEEKS